MAELLSKTTGWPSYGKELVNKISEDSGIREELLRSIDEQRPNWLAECFGAFTSERKMSQVGFSIRLRKVLLALAGHGNCIVLGRGAAQVMPPETTLRIRLIAPREYRLNQVAHCLKLSPKAAEKRMDQDRTDFVDQYFQSGSTDSRWYDMTIDTSRFQVSRCVDLITTALAGRRELISVR